MTNPTQEQTDQEHFILIGRLVGTDEGWADCICGWHYEGLVDDTRKAGDEHLDHPNTSAD